MMGKQAYGQFLPFSREQIEQEIERLIGLLDGLDADPDFEPDSDAEPDADGEPSLGWWTATNGCLVMGSDDDLEMECS